MQLTLEHFIMGAPAPTVIQEESAPAENSLPAENSVTPSPDDPNSDAEAMTAEAMGTLIAHSPALHPNQLLRWHAQHAPIASIITPTVALVRWREALPAPVPMPDSTPHEQASYFCVRVTLPTDDVPQYYHYTILTEETLASLGGDLSALLNVLSDFAITPNTDTPYTLDPLPMPNPTTWTLNKRVTIFSNLIDGQLDGNVQTLFSLLACALDAKGITIHNYPQTLRERLAFVQTLTMLLPSHARTAFTFSTYTGTVGAILPRITFDTPDDTGTEEDALRHHFDWATKQFSQAPVTNDYETLLNDLWDDDAVGLAEQLRSMEALAFQILPEHSLLDGLEMLARRFALDWRVQSLPPTGDDNLTITELLASLQNDHPPQGALRQQYVLHLLAHALKERDNTSAEICIAEIDADEALYEASTPLFQSALESEPDAVYAFVRVRCNISSTQDADGRWLARLRQSALRALNIALNDAPAESLAVWLRLLSREPLSFGLVDIVRDGVLRAVPRAAESSDLARTLLVIALKRTPDLLDTLLRDPNVLPPLASDDVLGRALLYDESQAIEALAETSRELFLLAVGSALDSDEPVINSAIVRILWELQTVSIAIIETYKPAHLLAQLPKIEGDAIQKNALQTLLRLYLTHEQDDAFYQACLSLAQKDALAPLLPIVLIQSGRDINQILILMNQLITRNALTSAEQIEIANDMLIELDWRRNALPLAEILARWLNQYPDVSVASSNLWKLLELADETHSEIIAKVTVHRILQSMNEQGIQAPEIAQLARCRQLTMWSSVVKERITTWWRRYTREHALSDLQKLDKALMAQRGMEDLRAIVHTTASIRRAIGQRSLSELSEHISIAHGLLLAFADNFDPDGKAGLVIDTDTISDLLQSREEELNPDERQVLVTNLRGLVQLITSMAEHRSKPSLIRSENAIERQIASGEQAPQSAVDVIRWLATYLESNDEG